MDINYYNSLKNRNTINVEYALARILAESGLRMHENMLLAGLLLTSQWIGVDSDQEFSDWYSRANLPEEVKSEIQARFSSSWETIKRNIGKIEDDDLLAYILFSESYDQMRSSECSTPSGINQLALKVLNIQRGDSVLDLCSGISSFFVDAFPIIRDNYALPFGIEINYSARNVALMRCALLGLFADIELGNALDFANNRRFEKVFSNYPLMFRDYAKNEMAVNYLASSLGVDEKNLNRASGDWRFNSTIITCLKENGKAVAIMSNGATWNTIDSGIRKAFVEKGLIEAVVSLPAGLLPYTSIPVTLMVFSKGNREITFVDAKDYFTKNRRMNVLSEANIEDIYAMLVIKDGVNVTVKKANELFENGCILSPERYIDVPVIENGIPLENLTVNITRGAQINAKEIDSISSQEETDYRYLTLANIKDGIVSFEDSPQYLREIPKNLEKFIIPDKAIILAKIGSPVFKSAVVEVEKNQQILASGNLYIIEVDQEKVNPYYIQAFLESEKGIALLKTVYAGAAMKTISLENLKGLPIPNLPKEQQKSIAVAYAAARDEYFLSKKKMQKSAEKMKHVFEENR